MDSVRVKAEARANGFGAEIFVTRPEAVQQYVERERTEIERKNDKIGESRRLSTLAFSYSLGYAGTLYESLFFSCG